MSCVNAIALYDYKATQSEELSIKKDEKLVILDDSKTWWQVENSKHETGYVPSKLCEKKANRLGKGWLKGKAGKSSKENGAAVPGEYFVPQDVLAGLESVIAKFNFHPQNDDETWFEEGRQDNCS
ncbi:Cytoplasmic protein nck1 [Desmophyllum pertusum]|uniref:Cytoplasmic protein nck1 n=1 Tax=Desmophyllum pertusum TaxID=174260 RepID=A0A9W9ZB32_9CNID|nr:Cytoplasmic protein nck1 [Desmophyllum pertusum]